MPRVSEELRDGSPCGAVTILVPAGFTTPADFSFLIRARFNFFDEGWKANLL
ncbi:MAG: hypothetical protein GX422_08455 [Deltaproteobacteria bacterium]|nr:hypothetical protein [Deltaproteobacteria bacterium]